VTRIVGMLGRVGVRARQGDVRCTVHDFSRELDHFAAARRLADWIASRGQWVSKRDAAIPLGLVVGSPANFPPRGANRSINTRDVLQNPDTKSLCLTFSCRRFGVRLLIAHYRYNGLNIVT